MKRIPKQKPFRRLADCPSRLATVFKIGEVRQNLPYLFCPCGCQDNRARIMAADPRFWRAACQRCKRTLLSADRFMPKELNGELENGPIEKYKWLGEPDVEYDKAWEAQGLRMAKEKEDKECQKRECFRTFLQRKKEEKQMATGTMAATVKRTMTLKRIAKPATPTADGLPVCKACGDTGRNSKGGPCQPCAKRAAAAKAPAAKPATKPARSLKAASKKLAKPGKAFRTMKPAKAVKGLLDYAKEYLRRNRAGLRAGEIVKRALEAGYTTSGKTPDRTLYSQILNGMKRGCKEWRIDKGLLIYKGE